MKHKRYTLNKIFNREELMCVNIQNPEYVKKTITNNMLRDLSDSFFKDGIVDVKSREDFETDNTIYEAGVVVMSTHDYDYMMSILNRHLDFRFIDEKTGHYISLRDLL